MPDAARRLYLITGASAGIGAAFARVAARNDWDVALTARRADRLEALAGELRRDFGAQALTLPADLAEEGAAERILAAVAAQGRAVDGLFNNAGYGLPGTYAASSWEEQKHAVRLMLEAPCELAHRVLPGMLERRFGRIVNVASLAGLMPGSAGHTTYGAIKSFLIKWSQSLHLECRDAGVHVSALCPGFTYSEFHDVNGTRGRVSELPPWMWKTSEAVVEAGWAAAEANRPVCVPGAPNKALAALAKALPDGLALALSARQSHRWRQA